MILVCYLLPRGYARQGIRFAESYRTHQAGAEHDFTLILKDDAQHPGWLVDLPRAPLIEHHANDGLDVGSLQRVCAEHPEYEQAMWLGAHSRILADGWLQKFYAAAQRDGVGAVTATGSFEAGVSYEAPNPHLRTSALMIAPGLLNSLGFAPARDRQDCYEFEHGQHSLYRRLQARGLKGVVVGRSGRAYEEDEWAHSGTFRRGEQSELLIADKHTDNFAKAPAEERMALALAAGMDP